MQMTIDQFITHESTADRKFREFHEANPQVYEQLLELTQQATARGRRKIGIGMLFEVIRWNHFLRTTGDSYKMNNNMRSRYARLIMDNHPEFEGIFEIRELKS